MSKNLRAVILIAIVIAAVGYSWSTWSYYTGGLPRSEPRAAGSQESKRSSSSDRARREDRAESQRNQGERPRGVWGRRLQERLNLTQDQQREMDRLREEIRSNPTVDRRALLQKFRETLTPEQQATLQQLRQEGEQRRQERPDRRL